MKRALAALVLSLVSTSLLSAQDKTSAAVTKNGDAAEARRNAASGEEHSPAEPAEKLPVRRVVLYKNGVGYFEHLGHIRGSQDVHIDFTSAQLNDVLKSLTVLDLSGGRITGVDYNSEFPPSGRQQETQLDSLRKEHSIHG